MISADSSGGRGKNDGPIFGIFLPREYRDGVFRNHISREAVPHRGQPRGEAVPMPLVRGGGGGETLSICPRNPGL